MVVAWCVVRVYVKLYKSLYNQVVIIPSTSWVSLCSRSWGNRRWSRQRRFPTSKITRHWGESLESGLNNVCEIHCKSTSTLSLTPQARIAHACLITKVRSLLACLITKVRVIGIQLWLYITISLIFSNKNHFEKFCWLYWQVGLWLYSYCVPWSL